MYFFIFLPKYLKDISHIFIKFINTYIKIEFSHIFLILKDFVKNALSKC